VLGEQDRRPPLLVEAAQQRRAARRPRPGRAARSARRARAARGRPASAAPSATRCSSPPESVAVWRSSSASIPSASATSSTAARDRDRVVAAVLERERELGPHRPHHDLRLGVLEQRADVLGERAGTVLAQVQPADLRAPGEVAAVEVRHEPADAAAAASTCPSPRAPASTTSSPRQLEAHVHQRRPRRARVACR
jgi:hypothetical protein